MMMSLILLEGVGPKGGWAGCRKTSVRCQASEGEELLDQGDLLCTAATLPEVSIHFV